MSEPSFHVSFCGPSDTQRFVWAMFLISPFSVTGTTAADGFRLLLAPSMTPGQWDHNTAKIEVCEGLMALVSVEVKSVDVTLQ